MFKQLLVYFKHRHLDISRKKVVIFIGPPRSGTTLVGYLLSQHPNALIANESRLVQRVVRHGFDYHQELIRTERLALYEYNHNRFEKNKETFQSKWQSVGNKFNFKKEKIEVVGDKKSGGAIQTYLNHSGAFDKWLEAEDRVHFVHVVRNPVDAARSYLKSHPHEVNSFESALEKIVKYNVVAENIRIDKGRPFFRLYFETLQKNPNKLIKEMFHWLELTVDDILVSMLSSVVVENTSNLTPEDQDKLAHELKKYDEQHIGFMSRYIVN